MTLDPMSSLLSAPVAQTSDLVVVLSARHPARDTGGQPRVGEPHYSLHLSASRLRGALSLGGFASIVVARPEIYSSNVARRFLAPHDQPIIHLTSGDFGSLRVLKEAYNIAYVAWEYEKISNSIDPVSLSFWKNQVRVLSLFDEVWVGAEFVKDTFEAAGVANVFVVPAPTPWIDRDRMLSLPDVIGDVDATMLFIDFTSEGNTKDALRQLTGPASVYLNGYDINRRKIILTVINPGDARKNVAATILGFLEIAEQFTDAILLVKLVVPTGTPLSDAIWDPLRFKFRDHIADGLIQSRQIIFIGDAWDELRLQSLMAGVDFYISTSFAEGLNLPVLESMAQETVVICPVHSAMVDYLDDTNCIPCAFHPVTVDGRMATGYAVGEVTRYDTTVADVATALRRALTASTEALASIRANALQAVRTRYDTPAVACTIKQRFAEIHSNLASAPSGGGS